MADVVASWARTTAGASMAASEKMAAFIFGIVQYDSVGKRSRLMRIMDGNVSGVCAVNNESFKPRSSEC